MIISKLRAVFLLAVGLASVYTANAQIGVPEFASDKYVISAKAGGVNYVEGTVTVERANGTSGRLVKGDKVDVDSRVLTGADGRAELLLNPGSYVRLGANSVFKFETVSLSDLQLKLDKGNALFEVFATDEFTVTITTPKGNATLIESGVYRVNVQSDGNATIAVTEGKATVGMNDPVEVKKGRTGTMNGGDVKVAKFDRGKRDEFDDWGRTRAKELARWTTSLRNKQARTSLMRTFLAGRWGVYESYGLWVYSPINGGYCFLPFGRGWNSPYGHHYGMGLYWYNLPPVIYNPPIHNPPVGPNPNGVKPPRGGGGGSDDTGDAIVPPYTKMEKMREPSSPIRNDRDRSLDFPTDSNPIRVYQPPPMPPPVYAPVPSSTGTKSRDN